MLNKTTVENVLLAALSSGGDFAEIFVEHKRNERIKMVGGKIENIINGIDYGVGIRIFEGLNSIYAYTNNTKEENLIKIAKEASLALNKNNKVLKLNFLDSNISNNIPVMKEFKDVDIKDKIDLVKEGYYTAKNYDKLISQVNVNYIEEDQEVLIANTEGIFVKDRRPRTRYAVTSIASKNGEMQIGFDAPGKSMGFEFYEGIDVRDIAKEASRIATVAVNSDYSPNGRMPVIIDNQFGGVLFHEACGHALEAESVSKGNSAFANKEGKQVASKLVTAIDDGTIKNAWGSSNVDDEGVATQKNLLIKDGILNSYLIDKLNGRRMNRTSTGSSRRQSYKYAPTSRMNNTYIAAGDSSFYDIINNTDYGIYAKKLGGGSVNPATGDFNFAVMEGYIVRNGKIRKPVRGATLVGNGIEVLEKIDMVGNNLELGQGMCGSISGSIPVNVGQPTIRVKELTVGGREEIK